MKSNSDSTSRNADGQSRASVALLPEPAQLFQAIAGLYTSTSPLVQWARELSDLHAGLIPFEFDIAPQHRVIAFTQYRTEIERVVGEVNLWAVGHVPRTKSARKHTHSLGEVISHIAKIYAEVWWTVLHSADAETRHQAWVHLSEAREGYAEMVNEIRAKQLQLPTGWQGVRRETA
ncbi:hypothetical protein ACQP1G_20245 [Nocardia sp. CA-107356]|uniref:hypothetical protein n=1 Tax=Nocardia sp. CA-107356 TaxID=3239972 RepID=UPI003D8F4697